MIKKRCLLVIGALAAWKAQSQGSLQHFVEEGKCETFLGEMGMLPLVQDMFRGLSPQEALTAFYQTTYCEETITKDMGEDADVYALMPFLPTYPWANGMATIKGLKAAKEDPNWREHLKRVLTPDAVGEKESGWNQQMDHLRRMSLQTLPLPGAGLGELVGTHPDPARLELLSQHGERTFKPFLTLLHQNDQKWGLTKNLKAFKGACRFWKELPLPHLTDLLEGIHQMLSVGHRDELMAALLYEKPGDIAPKARLLVELSRSYTPPERYVWSDLRVRVLKMAVAQIEQLLPLFVPQGEPQAWAQMLLALAMDPTTPLEEGLGAARLLTTLLSVDHQKILCPFFSWFVQKPYQIQRRLRAFEMAQRLVSVSTPEGIYAVADALRGVEGILETLEKVMSPALPQGEAKILDKLAPHLPQVAKILMELWGLYREEDLVPLFEQWKQKEGAEFLEHILSSTKENDLWVASLWAPLSLDVEGVLRELSQIGTWLLKDTEAYPSFLFTWTLEALQKLNQDYGKRLRKAPFKKKIRQLLGLSSSESVFQSPEHFEIST